VFFFLLLIPFSAASKDAPSGDFLCGYHSQPEPMLRRDLPSPRQHPTLLIIELAFSQRPFRTCRFFLFPLAKFDVVFSFCLTGVLECASRLMPCHRQGVTGPQIAVCSSLWPLLMQPTYHSEFSV